MKIWKLEKTIHGNINSPKRDTSDGCIVAANGPHKARQIAAEYAGDESSGFWMTPCCSSCIMISGVASKRVKEGMIIHSYIRG